MPGFDVEAVAALGEALADMDGCGDAFRAEPPGECGAIIDSLRLAYDLKAQALFERVHAAGYGVVRAR